VSSLLKSPSDALRIAAVETLGRIGTPQALDVLLSHLPGATGFERTATVKSLVQGGVTPPWAEVAEELREMFADGDWNVKQIAVKGFVALQEKRAIVSIIDYAGSLDPSEPETDEKVQVMKDALRSFGCREILAAVFDNLSLKYRGKSIAIEAIGELKCKEAVPYLVGLLEGEVRDVRRASMKALVDIDDGDIRRTLVDAIDDYDGHIRRMAFTALGRIADKASFEPIRKLLPAERYKDVMEEGVKALLSIDSSAVIPCLAEFDVSVREAIARFTEDAATLLALIGDRDFTVRVSAVAGLGRTRDARVCQTLTEAVRDPEAEVRKVAIKAMGELGCCHDVIKSALHDPDMWVRMCAVNALGSSMGQDTLKVLIPMLDDRDIPVVLSAIGAVSRIGGSEVVSILDALTGHPDEGVRKKAHTELEDMKSSGTFG
jgi:HEAT repeat protein